LGWWRGGAFESRMTRRGVKGTKGVSCVSWLSCLFVVFVFPVADSPIHQFDKSLDSLSYLLPTTRHQLGASLKNFFISYNSADNQWAQWITWQLEEAGYTIVIH
jgi:hypothetical protein